MTVSLTSAGSFCIKIKYSKTTLFVPVSASTSHGELKREIVSILSQSSQELPPSVGYSPSELLRDEELLNKVVGLFFGDKKDENGADSYIFQKVQDRVSGTDPEKISVAKMGLKEGRNEVLYLGFKSQTDDEISKPEVQEPPLLEDEEEEEEGGGGEEEEQDPDSRPSPPNLDDGEDVIMEEPRGKGKRR